MSGKEENIRGSSGAANAGMKPGDEAAPSTPGTGENVCPECRGTGRVGGAVCKQCNGTGKVTQGIGGG